MINISFIIPYPELENTVKEVFSRHPQRDMLNQNITLLPIESIDTVKMDCDVVVARGYTLEKLKKLNPRIPIIEIIINAYDIIRAVQECIRLNNPKKIGLIGAYSTIKGAINLCGLLNCPIEVYSPQNTSDINSAIKQACENGCDALIGGYSINLLAKAMGIDSIVIKTGEEAIEQALSEAIRTVCVMRQEREKAEIFRTVTKCLKEGIVYVSNGYWIDEINEKAQSMCRRNLSTFYKTRIQDAFPFMTDNIKEVLSSGEEKNNELHKMDNITISANYMPVKVEKNVAGVVVNFQNITKIQQVETQIRKKLSAKGLNAKYYFSDIIYNSQIMQKTIETAKKYARVPSNILLVGETGTGKELMAQSIHNESSRKEGPFVAVNCAALPENLLESELFGYVEGAFTGATKFGKMGLFELAHNGTLFLDEISEVPITFQSKLLRVLQEKEVRRIGDDKVISIDVRIIAATNRNLKELVMEGSFREDLLYRLDVLKLYIPPLRKRKSDIIDILMHFIDNNNKKFGTNVKNLTPDAAELLMSHDFRGNIRELGNIAERLSVLSISDTVNRDDLHAVLFPEGFDENTMLLKIRNMNKKFNNDSEKELIEKTLRHCGLNQTKAAKVLNIDRTTLWRKIIKYNIEL